MDEHHEEILDFAHTVYVAQQVKVDRIESASSNFLAAFSELQEVVGNKDRDFIANFLGFCFSVIFLGSILMDVLLAINILTKCNQSFVTTNHQESTHQNDLSGISSSNVQLSPVKANQGVRLCQIKK